MRKKSPLRVGTREHYWLYHGEDPWKALPYTFRRDNNGRPPEVLRRLVAKGWMWAERRQVCEWMPKAQQWSAPKPGAAHWCGLTAKGLDLIRQRYDKGR